MQRALLFHPRICHQQEPACFCSRRSPHMRFFICCVTGWCPSALLLYTDPRRPWTSAALCWCSRRRTEGAPTSSRCVERARPLCYRWSSSDRPTSTCLPRDSVSELSSLGAEGDECDEYVGENASKYRQGVFVLHQAPVNLPLSHYLSW